MQLVPSGESLPFEYAAYDGASSLFVAMKVYETTSGTPVFLGTAAMTHTIEGVYVGFFTPGASKSYLIIKNAYTDGTFTVADPNRSVASESIIAAADPSTTLTPADIAAVADAVWDELLAGHVIPGSAGHTLTNVDGNVTIIGDDGQFQSAIPQYVERPDVGTESLKVYVRIYDNKGNPKDPDGGNIDVTVVDAAGGVIFALSSMIRTATGHYEKTFTITTSALVGSYYILYDYEVSGDAFSRVDTTRVVDPFSLQQITDAVWNEPQAGHATAGTFGKRLDVDVSTRESEASAAARAVTDQAEHDATQAAVAAVNADTDDIQAKIGVPVGTISSDIASVKLDSAAIKVKTDQMAFTTGEIHSRVITNLDKINYTIAAGDKDALVDLIWNEFLAPAHQVAGTAGKALSDAAANSSPVLIADAVWDALVADHSDANTFGLLVDVIRQYVVDIDAEVTDSVSGLTAIHDEVIAQAAAVIVEVNANETKIDAIIPAVNAAKVAVIAEVDANEVKIDAIIPAVTAAKNSIIAEIDLNEVKLDQVLAKVDTLRNNSTMRFEVPARIIKPVSGSKDYEFRLYLYDEEGNPEAPDATPTLRIRRLDTGFDVVAGAAMTQDGVKVGAYYYQHTITSGTNEYPLLVEATVIENGVTRYIPAYAEITEFESDLNALQAQLTLVQNDVTTIESEILSGVHGLAVIRATETTIINEINANEVKIDAVKAQTDLIPASPATSAQVAAVTTAVLTRPDIAAIQARLDLLRDNLKGLDNRDLTQVYDHFDLTGVAQTSDPRFANLDATVSSRSTLTAAQVWASVSRTLTSSLAISAADLDAIWGYLVSQATVPNSIGKRIADFLDVAVSSRATAAQVTAALAGVAQEATLVAGVSNIISEVNANETKINTALSEIALVKAKTNNLPGDPASQSLVQSENDTTQLAVAALDLKITGVKAKTDNLPPDPAKETSVLARPTNPVLATDGRLNRLDVNVSTRGTLVAADLVPIAKTSEVNAAATAIIAQVDFNETKIDTAIAGIAMVKAKTDTIPVGPATEANVDAAETAILAAIAALPAPGAGLTAADVWSYATRTLTTAFPDISGLATTAQLAPLAKIQYVLKTSTAYNNSTGDQELVAWIEKDGQRAVGANCVVTVKTAAGVTVWTATLPAPNADGVFKFVNAITAAADSNYYIDVEIDLDAVTRLGRGAFTTVG